VLPIQIEATLGGGGERRFDDYVLPDLIGNETDAIALQQCDLCITSIRNCPKMRLFFAETEQSLNLRAILPALAP
jgi:hypothetical protein